MSSEKGQREEGMFLRLEPVRGSVGKAVGVRDLQNKLLFFNEMTLM